MATSSLAFNNIIFPVLGGTTQILFGHEEEVHAPVLACVLLIASTLFSILWILPLYFLSRIVTSLWFEDIAEAAYLHRPRNKSPFINTSAGTHIADMFFGSLVKGLFLTQGQTFATFPACFIAQTMLLVHMALLNALSAFDYCWSNQGWEVNRRLKFVELRLPYFFGFGLPLAIVTVWIDNYWINGCIFSMIFPLLIISANTVSPPLQENIAALPVFGLAMMISDKILNCVIRRPPYPPGVRQSQQHMMHNHDKRI